MIELENICKLYRMGGEDLYALRGINLSIEDKEFVAIIGPSGSGKSTLMNVVGCLDKASSGEYRLDGLDIGKYTPRALSAVRNKKIGFIFQQFNLLPRLTAYENVELPLLYQSLSPKDCRARTMESLERVGLGERMRHKPTELSGGQQQRVAIARALATKPSLILADEPTGNLDSKSGREVLDIIHGLHAEGNTIVLITHDPGVAAEAERCIRIADGVITADERRRVA